MASKPSPAPSSAPSPAPPPISRTCVRLYFTSDLGSVSVSRLQSNFAFLHWENHQFPRTAPLAPLLMPIVPQALRLPSQEQFVDFLSSLLSVSPGSALLHSLASRLYPAVHHRIAAITQINEKFQFPVAKSLSNVMDNAPLVVQIAYYLPFSAILAQFSLNDSSINMDQPHLMVNIQQRMNGTIHSLCIPLIATVQSLKAHIVKEKVSSLLESTEDLLFFPFNPKEINQNGGMNHHQRYNDANQMGNKSIAPVEDSVAIGTLFPELLINAISNGDQELQGQQGQGQSQGQVKGQGQGQRQGQGQGLFIGWIDLSSSRLLTLGQQLKQSLLTYSKPVLEWHNYEFDGLRSRKGSALEKLASAFSSTSASSSSSASSSAAAAAALCLSMEFECYSGEFLFGQLHCISEGLDSIDAEKAETNRKANERKSHSRGPSQSHSHSSSLSYANSTAFFNSLTSPFRCFAVRGKWHIRLFSCDEIPKAGFVLYHEAENPQSLLARCCDIGAGASRDQKGEIDPATRIRVVKRDEWSSYHTISTSFQGLMYQYQQENGNTVDMSRLLEKRLIVVDSCVGRGIIPAMMDRWQEKSREKIKRWKKENGGVSGDDVESNNGMNKGKKGSTGGSAGAEEAGSRLGTGKGRVHSNGFLPMKEENEGDEEENINEAEQPFLDDPADNQAGGDYEYEADEEKRNRCWSSNQACQEEEEEADGPYPRLECEWIRGVNEQRHRRVGVHCSLIHDSNDSDEMAWLVYNAQQELVGMVYDASKCELEGEHINLHF